ncbi:MAG TPA: NfeD family protein [Candidatus Lachnoclostridium pullistercoris]|uniref:NfeD family protein n=1 Tax=Candidatus Lachnoclostridium pullistercoris TaxID=2838632 RepID=A0A9D2T5S0_9FIRM|nr:NfeD family protein [Candidatus Lachnoclostridium pullistercoris]
MAAVYWLIGFVILIGIEAATMALTTIWFAGGALAAFLAALLGAGVEVQLAVFAAVSFLLLLFTRPFAARLMKSGKTDARTNVDSLIGKHAKVTEAVDNELGTGAAVVSGQEWTARAYDGESHFSTGETVVIRAVEGVKLMVSKS